MTLLAPLTHPLSHALPTLSPDTTQHKPSPTSPTHPITQKTKQKILQYIKNLFNFSFCLKVTTQEQTTDCTDSSPVPKLAENFDQNF